MKNLIAIILCLTSVGSIFAARPPSAQQLALFDRKTGDPAACRREMTRHILKLIDLEK